MRVRLRSAGWGRRILVGSVILGVAFRLLVLSAPGYANDVAAFVRWADLLRTEGTAFYHTYHPGTDLYYPPVLTTILWALGLLLHGEGLRLAVKALSIPADVGIAVLIARSLRGRPANAGAYAAALWVLQPAPVVAGPLWGQVDALGTLPLVAAVISAGAGRWGTAGALVAIAGLVKPLFGLIAVPVGAAALFASLVGRRPGPLIRAVGGGAVAAFALCLPFGLWPWDVARITTDAFNLIPYTSLLAPNLWAIVAGFGRADDPYLAIGLGLGAVGLLLSCIPLWRRRDLATLLMSTTFATFALYFLPTRVHERYLFPAFALLLPIAVLDGPLLALYILLSTIFAFVLLVALMPPVIPPDVLLGSVFSPGGQILLAFAMIVPAVFVVHRLIRKGPSLGAPRRDTAPIPGLSEI